MRGLFPRILFTRFLFCAEVALSEEERAELESLRADKAKFEADALAREKEELEALRKAKEEKEKSLNDKATESLSQEEKDKSNMDALANAISFNNDIAKRVKELGSIAPQKFSKILEIANTNKYSEHESENTIKKAADVRKSLIDEYVQSKKNLDILPPQTAAMVAAWKDFADDTKLKKSTEYFLIVDTGLSIQSTIAKKQAMENGGKDGSQRAPIASKIIESAKKYRESLAGKR